LKTTQLLLIQPRHSMKSNRRARDGCDPPINGKARNGEEAGKAKTKEGLRKPRLPKERNSHNGGNQP
jgi:hypothetical protein